MSDEEWLKWSKENPYANYSGFHKHLLDEEREQKKDEEYKAKCKWLDEFVKNIVGKTIVSATIDTYGNNEEYEDYDAPTIIIKLNDGTTFTVDEPQT